ncbi:hypothetical protein [Salinibacterium sp. TMP30]|uniref:hypothetical protein n=1 Tax=Salinibacterium sp. TMP30 TaxID=3138237 RepID=UPI003138AA7A
MRDQSVDFLANANGDVPREGLDSETRDSGEFGDTQPIDMASLIGVSGESS